MNNPATLNSIDKSKIAKIEKEIFVIWYNNSKKGRGFKSFVARKIFQKKPLKDSTNKNKQEKING